MAQMGKKPRSDLGAGRQRTVWLTPEAWASVEKAQQKSEASFSEAVCILLESCDPGMAAATKKRELHIKNLERNLKESQAIISKITGDLKRLEGLNKQNRKAAAVVHNYDAEVAHIHPRVREKVKQRLIAMDFEDAAKRAK